MRRFHPSVVLSLAVLCGCSGGDSAGDDTGMVGGGGDSAGGAGAGGASTGGAAGEGGAGGAEPAPRNRWVVTADWLNGSLSVLSLDLLVQGGATTREEALVKEIDLSDHPPGPLYVAVSSDERTAVVAAGPAFLGILAGPLGAGTIPPGGSLLVVDLESGEVTATLPEFEEPMGIAIAPDGSRAYVVDHVNDGEPTLGIVSLPDGAFETWVDIGGNPEEITLSVDGTLGVVNTDSNESIRFFDTSDPVGTLSDPLRIGGDPGGLALSPDKTRLVIAKSLPLTAGDITGYALVNSEDPDAATILQAETLPGTVPYGATWIPGTDDALVTVGCSLVRITATGSTASVAAPIALPCADPNQFSLPLGVAVDASGEYAFVAVPGDDSLVMVQLDTGATTRFPWLESTGPTYVALSPGLNAPIVDPN